jgi:hypothetical protein
LVWIGTKGSGLIRFKDGAFTLISMKDGLLSDNIQCLYMDQEGAPEWCPLSALSNGNIPENGR